MTTMLLPTTTANGQHKWLACRHIRPTSHSPQKRKSGNFVRRI